MLADIPVGESPIRWKRSVTTVVIPDVEKGDRLVGSSGVKAPVGWGKFLVRSVQGGEQLYTAAAN